MLEFVKSNKVKTKLEKKAHKNLRKIRQTKNGRWTTKDNAE